MAPQITAFSDLTRLAEVFDKDPENVLYTEFHVIDEDDVVYHGQIKTSKLKISLAQYSAALPSVPDEELYPELPADAKFTLAPENITKDTLYLKRPRVDFYGDYKEQNVVELLPLMLLEEIHALEIVSQHPHPNIVRYYGCRVRRGRITALVLDRYSHDLKEYLRDGVGTIDKKPFMAGLESAVQHLHALGLAHNDINPRNIMVNEAGTAVLIDFGSCREVGRKLGVSRGTPGWIEGEESDYDTSGKGHDLFAVERIRVWLDDPTF
ncbi:kinase-like protein [Parachaetomium inaequale]|uniref:Kinase-like protein n=1 Tax=Parachaetomium inaequale TaxID=2588326 RepID=A0AAN6PHH7_9PEZI|nr:kinase-like protein [Parachaetomium inaequale]